MNLRDAMRFLEDQIVPRSCAFCGTPSFGDEQSICSDCLADLPWTASPGQHHTGAFQCIVTPLSYEFPVDAAIKALKFKRQLVYAAAFAEILCIACDHLPNDIDAVMPVPLHWRRKAFRGFNQAMELAKPVAKCLRVPIAKGVYRNNATAFQSGLAARERDRNMRGAFVSRARLTYTHVLIIDDVVTTGATARAVARVLRVSGVERVSVLAVASAN